MIQQTPIDSLSSLLQQVPMINFLFLAANTFMMLSIKLAIQTLKTEIANDRKKDSDDIKKWAEDKFEFKSQHHPQHHAGGD